MAVAQRLRVCRKREQAEDKANGTKRIAHFEEEEKGEWKMENGKWKMMGGF